MAHEEIVELAKRARRAAREAALLSTPLKDAFLKKAADALTASTARILKENAKDVEAARQSGMNAALIDRLTLNEKRVQEMSMGLREIAKLPDPVGEVVKGWTRPNGLKVEKVRIPLGVIAIVYESRPNVTVDAAGLCLKSGNVVILRGGSEAIHSNLVL
jgi:glutamate-5-semialdehyde dehydrogenase